MPQPQQQQTDDPAMIAAQEINTNVFSGQGYRGAEDDIAAIIRQAHAALTAERDGLREMCRELRAALQIARDYVVVGVESNWAIETDHANLAQIDFALRDPIDQALAGGAPR